MKTRLIRFNHYVIDRKRIDPHLKKYQSLRTITLLMLFLASSHLYSQPAPKTVVEIRGEKFFINGTPTYEGRMWQGHPIEGLLMNTRMVQGIFDDLNPSTRDQWKYPDTRQWNPDRNTNEFIQAMEEWKSHGVLAFTLNLQGGSPTGYGNKGWINSAFVPDGTLRKEYCIRLERILNRADELNMVVILGLFYFGQDQLLQDEAAVVYAVDRTIDWLFDHKYSNLLIEINNECSVKSYDHEILKKDRVHELILRVKNKARKGFRFLVGTSYGGNTIPTSNVVQASDFILIHGNGVSDPNRIKEMVQETKKVDGYQPMPILFNEDDHYDFEKPFNNLVAAVQVYASWGFFDYRREGELYDEGYQSVPVNWKISSVRKKGFFKTVHEITSGE
ncbi:MAG: hypothetical protein V1799_11375 [bacterium]